MQDDDQTCKTHHEKSGPKPSESVYPALQMTYCPIDERGHAGALERKCERYQSYRGGGLVEKSHCLYMIIEPRGTRFVE